MKTLAATAAAVAATAAAGSRATSDMAWYRRLRKPPFTPPPLVFPIVWTGLYAGIAAGSARALDTSRSAGHDEQARAFEAALATNLALNGSWSWVFFRAHRPWLATAHSAVLTASTADLARRARHADPVAHALLAPYLAWTGFATVLAGSVAWLNRRR